MNLKIIPHCDVMFELTFKRLCLALYASFSSGFCSASFSSSDCVFPICAVNKIIKYKIYTVVSAAKAKKKLIGICIWDRLTSYRRGGVCWYVGVHGDLWMQNTAMCVGIHGQ